MIYFLGFQIFEKTKTYFMMKIIWRLGAAAKQVEIYRFARGYVPFPFAESERGTSTAKTFLK